MNILDRIKFLFSGDLDKYYKKAHQEGYDKCFNGAMRHMIRENR
jgi:hypothetical protein